MPDPRFYLLTKWYTGPFAQDEPVIIADVHVKNYGTSGIVYLKAFLNPNTLDEIIIQSEQMNIPNNQMGMFYVETIFNNGGIFPAGVKIWGEDETEPEWGIANKTHTWDIKIEGGCQEFDNQTDCEGLGCYWWANACHDYDEPDIPCGYPNKYDCELYGCLWYNGSCHQFAPEDCSEITNLLDCETLGCYWYNGACHNNVPSCEILNNSSDCLAYNCYWYRNQCHSVDQPEICFWVDEKGGPDNLLITDVFEIVDSYLFNTPPVGYTFIPTLQNIFGIIDYFLGFNGDSKTGCSFY